MAFYHQNKVQWPVQLPIDPYTAHSVCLPLELLPTILGALEHIAVADRYGKMAVGVPYLSYIRGVQYMVIQGCNQGWQQIYMLLDSIYNGQQYVYSVVDGVEVIAPPIPPVPVAPRTNQMDANETIIGLIGDGILGEAVTSPYPVAESIRAILQDIRDNSGGWTDEEKAQVISALVDNLPALLQILAAL